MNSHIIFSLETDDVNQVTVECSPGQDSIQEQPFECEFCYNLDSSCQSRLVSDVTWTCIVLPNRTVSLPSWTAGTYCYHATSIIDGTSFAVVQDTFSITRSQRKQQGWLVIIIKLVLK